MPRFFSNLSLKSRLVLGFTLVLLMMCLLTAMGITRVNTISNSLTTIGDLNSVKQRYAINFRGSVHDRAISLRDVVLAPQGQTSTYIQEISQLAAAYAESAVLLDKMFDNDSNVSPDEKKILASIKDIEAHTLPLINRVIELRNSGQHEAAVDLMLEQARPAFIEWLARINQFIDLQERMNQAESSSAREVAAGFQTFMIAITLLSAVLGVLIVSRPFVLSGALWVLNPMNSARLHRALLAATFWSISTRKLRRTEASSVLSPICETVLQALCLMCVTARIRLLIMQPPWWTATGISVPEQKIKRRPCYRPRPTWMN